jgi:thiamine-monophosphate kinase
MDVSDGLLIDAARIAEASALGLTIDLAMVPLSADYADACGDDLRARVDASVAGDDYELLFAAHQGAPIEKAAARCGIAVTAVGRFGGGQGLRLLHDGAEVPLSPRLGWQHGRGRPSAGS